MGRDAVGGPLPRRTHRLAFDTQQSSQGASWRLCVSCRVELRSGLLGPACSDRARRIGGALWSTAPPVEPNLSAEQTPIDNQGGRPLRRSIRVCLQNQLRSTERSATFPPTRNRGTLRQRAGSISSASTVQVGRTPISAAIRSVNSASVTFMPSSVTRCWQAAAAAGVICSCRPAVPAS